MPTLITKRGTKRWKASKMVNGISRAKLFPDATKKSQRAAIAWEEKTEKAMRNGRCENTTATLSGSSPQRNGTLRDWATEYLMFAKARYAVKTFDEKRRAFDRFFAMTDPKRPAQDLTQGDVLRFLQDEMTARSGNQANRARKNLVAAWNWGMRYLFPPLPGPNPCLVERMPEEHESRYIPPVEDFFTVLDACTDPQDRTMLMVAAHTAARRGEIFRIRHQDLDFQGGQIRLWTRKRAGGSWEYDWIPMTTDLRPVLLDWVETRLGHSGTDPDHLFVVIDEHNISRDYWGKPFRCRQHFIRRLCEHAQVKPFGFHAIRHLTASILFRKGHSVEIIQQVLRHQSANTTTKYLHSIGCNGHVRAAMDDALTRPEAEIIDLHERRYPERIKEHPNDFRKERSHN